MYVLTKRSAPNGQGQMSHSVYGITPRVDVARAWFRSTRVTDVFELEPRGSLYYGRLTNPFLAQDETSIISAERLESWREQQFREELEQARIKK